ncbi:MAG: hypothetical protein IPG10_06600 [Flavobacteriales bacterium]|nr:hypothetical protein [Flavobacteriales bacterium]MBK6755506.1 hypothetical protein [Flavobacteriales bacterium]
MAHHRPTRREGKALPMKGRVVVGDVPYRISCVTPQADGSFTYTLTPPDAQHRVLHQVAHAELIKQMADHARYTVGRTVILANSAPMRITKRQWDFRNGTVWYYAAVPNRTIGAGWIKQETMLQLDRELDPVLDTDEEPTLPGRSSPPPDWL